MVIIIAYKHVTQTIRRNPIWMVKLAISRTLSTPCGQKSTVRVELLDTMVVCICHKDVACANIKRYALWVAELILSRTLSTQCGQKSTVRVEFMDKIIAVIRYEDTV